MIEIILVYYKLICMKIYIEISMLSKIKNWIKYE